MKKVLICPLNWGLGHATRCIPIAQEFQRQGFEVDFASDGGPLDLLRMEFPAARFHELPGYAITYPTNNIIINIGRRMMSLLQAVREEHRVMKEIAARENYDILVSDNRYGCYTPETYNIFITHQVNILTPGGVLDPAVNAFNQRYIRKYNECWIPDFESSPGLTGRLGHDHNLSHARYIGPVSRMEKIDCPIKYKLTAVISGPEPQRTILEKLLREKLPQLPFPTALIGGVISTTAMRKDVGQMVHFPFLPSVRLNELMAQSEVILCRGGYTTAMDLTALGKKAICIPTPGQTEQEYLTKLYDRQGYFLRQTQDKMDLQSAMANISEYSGIPMKIEPELVTDAVRTLY